MRKLKQTTALQSGRSMVEMLGTLAIIGVLSIGGIAGYRYGMDKYRANETINDINLRGIDLVRQVSMGQEPSLSEWETKSTAGYTFSEAQLSAEGDAYFSISGVPKRVCEIVYEGIQNNQTTDIEVNEATNGDASDCHKDDDNVMVFFFITNAGEGGSVDELCKDVTCTGGYSCTHGICMSEEVPQLHSGGVKTCETDSQCSECQYCDEARQQCENKDNGTICSGGACYNGTCVFDETTCVVHDDCEEGYFCDTGGTNKCVKFEFYRTPLTGVYLSKLSTNVSGMCEMLGFYTPTKEKVMEIATQLGNSIISYAVYLDTSDSGGCAMNGYCHDGERHALCLDDTAE